MTKKSHTTKKEINEIMARAAHWPEDAQDELLQSMLDIEARYFGIYVTNKDEQAALKRSEDDVRTGRFATETDLRKVFRRFHRA